MAIIPNSRPKRTKEECLASLAAFDLTAYKVQLLGVRGYYKQTMGNPVKNDRGIYDDAIFIISPDAFAAFNANTDPSVTRPGIAVLKKGGPYLYKIGTHGISGKSPHEALRQYGRVTVVRDEVGERTDTARAPFWINIHRGGWGTTSSLGCQTVYPAQWLSFISMVKDQLARFGQKIVPYVLIEES